MNISIKVIAEKNFRGSNHLQEEVVSSGDTFAKKTGKNAYKKWKSQLDLHMLDLLIAARKLERIHR